MEEKNVTVKTKILSKKCQNCNGTGRRGGLICSDCGGSGQICDGCKL